MEFTDLSRYRKINDPVILPFSQLRTLRPLWMTQDLQVVNDPDNIAYADNLASKSLGIIPIRKKEPSAKYVERKDFPRRVILEMTSKCNFLCRMCPQQNLKRERVDMPKDLYIKIIDEIDQHGIEGLWTYHLGESLLHPDFKDILRHISTKKHLGIIWMSTNGYYFTKDNIESVLQSNIDYINFSAHAITKETYETVAPGGVFDIVQKNLGTFYQLKGSHNLPRKPFLHCQMIEQETTKHETDGFLRKHYKKADIVSINMLEYVNLPNNQYGLAQRQRKPLKNCLRVARNDCFICSNGDVTLCDAAYNGEILLGNIYEQSLYDIWTGPERKKILNLNNEGRMAEICFCQNCTDYDI